MLLDIDEASRTRPGRLLPHETRDTLFYIISLAWLAILLGGIPFAAWLMQIVCNNPVRITSYIVHK